MPLRDGLRHNFLVLFLLLASLTAWAEQAYFFKKADGSAHMSADLIESAQNEIISMEFLVRDDSAGLEKMALLRKQAQQGKTVIWMVDAMHWLAHPAYQQVMLDAGVKLYVFNPVHWERLYRISMRGHFRGLVVDGTHLGLTDANSASEYSHRPDAIDGHTMQSRATYVKGEAATEAREYAFTLLKSGWLYKPQVRLANDKEFAAQQKQIAKKVARHKAFIEKHKLSMDSPEAFAKPRITFFSQADYDHAVRDLDQALELYERDYRVKWAEPMAWVKDAVEVEETQFWHDLSTRKRQRIANRIARFIQNATQKIYIDNAYFIPTPKLKRAMSKALERVQVDSATNSMQSSDNPRTQKAYERHFPEYANTGTHREMYEKTGTETLHVKNIVSGSEAVMSSSNFDNRSEAINLETAVYIRGQKFANIVRDQMIEDRQTKYVKVVSQGQILPSKTLSCQEKVSLLMRLFLWQFEKQL